MNSINNIPKMVTKDTLNILFYNIYEDICSENDIFMWEWKEYLLTIR